MDRSRAVEELLGHTDVSTTMIYTHVLNRGWGGVCSLADRLPGPAAHIALGIPAGGRRLMLQAGLDNKAAALLPKPPQPRGEPVGPKQIRLVCLIIDGADASHRAIGVADCHPLSVRRVAPAIKRMQRTVVHANMLARPPAADPQRR